MNRLFAKIFVAFWITTIAVVLATAFATMQINRSLSEDPLQAHFFRTQSAYAEAAASILDSQGLDALRLWMHELHGPGGVHGHLQLLGDDGSALFGSPSAGDISAALAAKRSGVSSPEVINGVFFDPLYGPDGERFWFVSDMRRNPKLGPMFRNPARPRGPTGIRFAIAILISGLICFTLARYLTIPIRRLQAASAEISSGNFKVRVDSGRRGDELGDLGRDFNRMAEQLEQLESSREQLVRDVSHELRSPLARLEIALGLARKRAQGKLNAELDRIGLEAQSLEDLIQQLLSISRIESGVADLAADPLPIDELVDEVANDADYEAADAGKTVTVEGRTDFLIRADRALLKSAIENVVRNALTHTPARSAVKINLRCDAEDVAIITVDDSGPGVADDRIEELFKPFVRGDVARARETGGFGIGLAIADASVRRHGGTISARNRSGGGFRVEIRLPVLKS
jgi:two-component system sensor histidine kinase CpxA